MRIEALTFLRFVAAAIVVNFHFGVGATHLYGALISGPEMVSFFFVLSGFVMGISYLNREIGVRSYWWARTARIMPVYLLALALVILANIVSGKLIDTTALVLSTLLLQSWFPPYPATLNTPGWSLSVEAFFYFSFPFILRYIKKVNASALRITCYSLIVWFITQALTTMVMSNGMYAGQHTLSHDLIFYFPLTHFCSFILGVSGAMWVLSANRQEFSEATLHALILVTSVVLIWLLNNKELISEVVGLQFAFGSSFFAPLFLSVIVFVALCRSRLIGMLSSKPLVLLGEASYSLYILQKPIHSIFERYVSGIFNFEPLADFILFFLFLTSVSIATFLMFERPVNQYLRYSFPRMIDKPDDK
jgi:peptidoglycan/LPS O-acetylase OafA/YrhL